MSIEGLAAKRIALQTALGTRAGRLLEAQYDALIAAQYDTPEALLDASEGRLEKVLKVDGAVDAVLAWQREMKQGAGGAAGGSEDTQEMRRFLASMLTPVRDLLNIVLLGNTMPTAPSSTRQEKQYRSQAVRFYYGLDTVPDELTCMVTGEKRPANSIRAGHVYRRAWNEPLLKYLAHMGVNDPRNIVFMRTQVEEKFDLFEIAIIPQAEDDHFKVVVLNQGLLDKYIGSGSKDDSLKWADVDDKRLHVGHLVPGHRPARRVLATHATLAVAWAESQNWIGKGVVQVPQEGWSSPGYDPARMHEYLSMVGRLNYSAGDASD